VIIRRTRSPEIRWGRDPSNDSTANGSAGVNSPPDLGGQRCGNHEDRGDSSGNRQLAEHLSLLGPNPPSIGGGADRPQSVQGVRVLNEVRQKCGTKNPEGPLPRDLGPIAGAIDQHTSKVGLLNLAWYEA
jgi:hypothetical protein